MASTTNIFSDFQTKYRYRIGGTFNSGFSNLARTVNNEDTEKRLKSRLTSNTIQINQLRASGGDEDSINKKVGQLQLNYVRTATQALYDVRLDTDRLMNFRSSINSTSKDLETAINSYLSSNTRTTEEDALFKKNAEYILRKLNTMYTIIKGRSAAKGTQFDINMYQANRRIDKLRALLADMPVAGATAPPAAESASVDDGSISGTSSGTGTTLDVTA